MTFRFDALNFVISKVSCRRRVEASPGRFALLLSAGLMMPFAVWGEDFKPSPNFPHDVTDQTVAYPKVSFDQLATFAWQEFVALNYPADPNHRGRPLAGATLGADPSKPRVWETYWHRVEVFPFDGKPVTSGGKADVTAKPSYRYSPAALTLDASTFDDRSTGAMNNQLWNNLDEDSELNIDEMFGRALSGTDFTNANRIVYEAKMNEVGFNYILKNGLEQASTRGKILEDTAQEAMLKQYGSTCGTAPAGVVSLPCGSNSGDEGYVEIKAAWRALTAAEASSGKFHTREVIHYQGDDRSGTTVNKWRVDTYGLIGLHIIHKSANFPSFTFATFEHVDTIGDPKNGVATIGYIDETTQTGRGGGDTFGNLVLVTDRDHPIPDPVAAANMTAQAALNGTVWSNYQLVGIQAYPSDVGAPRSAATAAMSNVHDNSSFFLANIAIETNEELQNFTGFQAAGKPNDANTWSAQQHYNMGGCMGCHGVAQNAGADFSFLIANAPFTAPEVVGGTGNLTPFPIYSYADVEEMFSGYVRDNPINISGSPHKAFWNKRHGGYDNFVNGTAAGHKIADCTSPAANSNIIKLLQGPLSGMGPPRMPEGGPYFPQKQIDYLADWINAGCPEMATARKEPPKVEPSLNELLAKGDQTITNYACQTLQGVRNSCGSDYINSICPSVEEGQCATECNCYNCALPTAETHQNSSYPSAEYLDYPQCR